MDDLLLVGRVARAHGNRGQVIVNLETDFPEERFQVGRTVLVGAGENSVARKIREVRFHQGRPILSLEGVSTMDDAEALAGAGLWVSSLDLAPLPDGTFYRHDLVGCEVVDVRNAVVGTVAAVEGTLERSYLVVQGGRGEVLIPLAGEICVRIDPKARLIVVNPPEGLLDVNASGREV
jgi:16S rRNA processing protein RimM